MGKDKKKQNKILIADVEDITEELLPSFEKFTGFYDGQGNPIYKKTELGVEQYIAKGFVQEIPFILPVAEFAITQTNNGFLPQTLSIIFFAFSSSFAKIKSLYISTSPIDNFITY